MTTVIKLTRQSVELHIVPGILCYNLEAFWVATAFCIMSSSLKVELNKEIYSDILRRLRDAVRRKRP